MCGLIVVFPENILLTGYPVDTYSQKRDFSPFKKHVEV
jgi:hypothetical protein